MDYGGTPTRNVTHLVVVKYRFSTFVASHVGLLWFLDVHGRDAAGQGKSYTRIVTLADWLLQSQFQAGIVDTTVLTITVYSAPSIFTIA
jgi:hypothetical protein